MNPCTRNLTPPAHRTSQSYLDRQFIIYTLVVHYLYTSYSKTERQMLDLMGPYWAPGITFAVIGYIVATKNLSPGALAHADL